MNISSSSNVYNINAAYMRRSSGGGSAGSAYFKEWEAKYENLKFSVGELAFSQEGIGNVTISKTQLREIESDATKRAEFESMLEDCNKATTEMKDRGGSQLVSQGFFYNKEGELQGWTIAKNYSGTSNRYIATLDQQKPSTWYNAMTVYTALSDPNATNWGDRFGR